MVAMQHEDEALREPPPPPWIALPGLSPDEPANQGAAEAYVVLTFRPFWGALTAEAKAAYLDHWDASPEWRAAIAFNYDHEGFDIEADARDAQAWAAAHPLSARPWWAFWRR